MSRPKRDLKRLNVNLPTQLYEALEKKAESTHLDKTSALVYILTEALEEYINLKEE